MSGVAAKIKIMPEDVETDLNMLKQKIKEATPAGAKVNGEIIEQPIAFGLKALIVTIIVEDSEGGTEDVEAAYEKVPGVAGLQILELDRI
ncbi:elongation factor 1-beta [Methanolapillus millepedarum]|uniref:Elongation factor 1-beta n=1 Tax=Methanolapillus millepedarum TaxID=3028296 RepID=A0AA96VEM9_9EURY|nr:hypothetical protein MsAc7_07630 [Methanosarcinaceae archaeon Ac7]